MSSQSRDVATAVRDQHVESCICDLKLGGCDRSCAASQLSFTPYFAGLSLRGRRCLVVGGGPVALQKLRGLLGHGAELTLVAPDAVEQLAELAQGGSLVWHRRAYQSEDVCGAFIVIAATDKIEINRAVCADAQVAGALVSVVNAPVLSDFITPAIVQAAPATLAVSTSGASPVLASRIKRELSERYASSSESAGDRHAARAARARGESLLKPKGGLGALEELVERWAAATGDLPPAPLHALHLIFAADHGHTCHGTSPYPSALSAQIAAASVRGESAIAVLARAREDPLVVVDIGLRERGPDGCLSRSFGAGTADMTAQPAMALADAERAIATGSEIAAEALERSGAACLVLGEIGVGNTATSAAVYCALMNVSSPHAVDSGSGLDIQGIVRKRLVVEAALRRHGAQSAADPVSILAGLGGFEHAGIVGAIHAAHDRGVPLVLDGLACTVAAMVAVRLRPACRSWLFAGHRSRELAHARALEHLGLKPLLDIEMGLGEGSGAALVLPLIESAGRLYREMATLERPILAATEGK